MKNIKLPENVWSNPGLADYAVPDELARDCQQYGCAEKPALKPDRIESAVKNPIGMKPLRELAKGRKEVVIIFDDMTRSTRTYAILPSILDELNSRHRR